MPVTAVEGLLRWGRWAHRRVRPIAPRLLNEAASRPMSESGDALASAARLRRLSLEIKAEASTTDGRLGYCRVAGSEHFRRLRDEATVALRSADPSQLGEPERVAFWVNVYNALVIQASVEFGLRGRIDELGGLDGFFIRAAYDVGGQTFSLDDIEHGILRANRRHGRSRGAQFGSGDPRATLCLDDVDPRLHFVLHCGAASCPIVGVLDAGDLEQQLNSATRAFLEGPDGVAFDQPAGRVLLPAFMQWNAGDFGGESELLPFVRRYVDVPDVEGWPLDYHDYDWRLG